MDKKIFYPTIDSLITQTRCYAISVEDKSMEKEYYMSINDILKKYSRISTPAATGYTIPPSLYELYLQKLEVLTEEEREIYRVVLKSLNNTSIVILGTDVGQ